MLRKVALIILLMALSAQCLATVTYVKVSLNVAEDDGTKPTSLKSTGTMTYDSNLDPVHKLLPVQGIYNASTGVAYWYFPASAYVHFVVPAFGIDDTYQIGASNCLLNDLIPAATPPAPSWSQLLVPYTGAAMDVNLGAYTLKAGEVHLGDGTGNDTADLFWRNSATTAIRCFSYDWLPHSIYIGMRSSNTYRPNAWYNITIGDGAGDNLTDGADGNVLIGQGAGEGMDDEDYNTCIGYGSGISGGSWTNSIAIGNNARVTGSNRVQLGNADVADGYIGEHQILTEDDGGTVPTPATPGDDGKVLTAGDGSWGWQAASGGNSFGVVGCPSGDASVSAASAGATINLAAGTGISITGNNTIKTATIANTAPDQTVAFSSTAAVTVGGTYPNFTISSRTYNANDPRPAGWPGTAANALDEEFNGTGEPAGFEEHTESGTITETQAGGMLSISGAGSVFYAKSVGDPVENIQFACRILQPNYESAVGIFVVDANGTGIGTTLYYYSGGYFRVRSQVITTWTLNGSSYDLGSVNYSAPWFLGIRYYDDGGTNKVGLAYSVDGKNFQTWKPANATSVPTTCKYIGFYALNDASAGQFDTDTPAQYIDWLRIK